MIFKLTTDQQNIHDSILSLLLSSKHCCIDAPAGTGKTTIVKQLYDELFMNRKNPPVLTATTHKAAEVLSLKTGRDTMTIHSALGLKPKICYKTGTETFVVDKNGFSIIEEDDVVIIDESSMIPSALFAIIIDTIKRLNITVLFVGDSKQLNPVNEELSPALSIPNKFTLTEIIRTDNSIVQASAFIREKIANNETLSVSDLEQFEDVNVFSNKKEFDNAMNKESEHTFLCWTNKCSQKEASRYRKFLNHDDVLLSKGEEIVLLQSIVVNKKIVGKNNSVHTVKACRLKHVKTIAAIEIETTTGLKFYSNIDFQPITELLKEMAEDAKMDSSWRTYFSTKEMFCPITFKHTMTIHKSQGSDIQNVFIDADDIMKNNNYEEMMKLFYVGVSRGVKSVNILLRKRSA